MTKITLVGTNEGITVNVPDTMTIAAIERWLRDIEDWIN